MRSIIHGLGANLLLDSSSTTELVLLTINKRLLPKIPFKTVTTIMQSHNGHTTEQVKTYIYTVHTHKDGYIHTYITLK